MKIILPLPYVTTNADQIENSTSADGKNGCFCTLDEG
jgi:hypothetical protein